MNQYETRESHTLRSALAALRSEYLQEPATGLEIRLRNQLRRRRDRRRLRTWTYAAILAAASLLVFSLIPAPRPPAPRPPAEMMHPRSVLPEAAVPERQAQAAIPRHQMKEELRRTGARVASPLCCEVPQMLANVRSAAPAHRYRRRRTHKPGPAEPQPPAAETATGFLAIPYSEPLSPTEQIDVYRVEMPRVTLTRFGLPMQAGTLNTTVTADLAVGSDGVARAVRFVR